MSQMPASILSGRPTRSRLDRLPNEVLGAILSFSCGVTTLYAFTKANSQAQALFQRSPSAFLNDAIYRSSMDLQFQKMLSSIISLRQRRKGQVADEGFRNFVHRTLSDEFDQISSELSSIQPTDSMDILAHAANLCDFVTDTERSFIRVRLPKVAHGMRLVAAKDRFCDKVQHPITSDYQHQHPSATEIHRIRRALWRVCLYLEAFYTPYVPQPNNEHKELVLNEFEARKIQTKSAAISTVLDAAFKAKRKCADFQKCFFQKMTVWELEEMNCVWNHLSHEHNTFWHRPCPQCHRSLLPDELIDHLQERRHHMNEKYKPSIDSYNFRNDYKFVRFKLETGLLGRTSTLDTAAWSGSLARESSDGFLYHLGIHGLWSKQASAPVMGCGQSCSFIDWACCMWDQDRISALGPFDKGTRENVG